MQRIARWVSSAEMLVAGIATAILLGCVLWGVLTRYVTAQPAAWTAELAGILFTWIVFLGATATFQADDHIRVTLLVDMLPVGARRAMRILVELFIIAFLLYAAWLSFVMLGKGATRPSPVLRIPFSWVYLAPLIGFGLMSVSALLRLFGLIGRVQLSGDNPEAA